MNRVAILSIVLAMAAILLPWQICDCSEDGPHLRPIWAGAECHPADPATPSDRSGEPEDACDGLFQFEGLAAPAAVDLPAPNEGDACARLSAQRAVCDEDPPARESALRVRPPGDPRPASPLSLATRLLL